MCDFSVDFFVVVVFVFVLVFLDEYEDVVDVDFDLFDEFDFEDDVVVDEFFFSVGVFVEFGV